MLIALTIVLAGLTKRFVEDPLRAQRGRLKPLWRTFAIGAVCMALVAATAIAITSQVEGGVKRDTEAVAKAELDPDRCFAGGAIRDKESCEPVGGAALITSPGFARRDTPRVYRDECVTPRPYLARPNCVYGDRGSSTRVALLGNSVATQWFPAAEGMAQRNKWELRTYLAATCYPVLTERADFNEPGVADSCRDFQQWAISEIIRAKTDLVVVSSRTNAALKDVPTSQKRERAARAYLAMLNLLTDKGIRVVVIGNNPDPGVNVPDCVAENLSDPRSCDVKRDEAVKDDPLMVAAGRSESGLISQLDAADLVCLRDRCPAVIGGVIGYRDFTHLSATMTRSLRPELERTAERALALR